MKCHHSKSLLISLLFFKGVFLFSQGNQQSKTTEYIQSEKAETHNELGSLRSNPEPEKFPELILAPPGNDNCASATNLTVGATCITGTSDQATTQGGEYLCISPGGGISPETVWYRVTATNDSLVLGIVLTNKSNCATVLAVYGPFAPGGGCLPGAGSQRLCQNMGLIDPGYHPLLTGLVIGQDYLVQVQGNNCGGGSDRFVNFCIGISNPSVNAYPGSASSINNCGVAFTGSTRGGHWNNGTSIGSNNLDNNAGTTCAGASEVGDDVTFVINNVSWFTYCNGNASSCNWSVNVNNINGCVLPAPNNGVQIAVFSGTPAALTSIAQSPSRVAPGSSWNSGTYSIGAGACSYIMVDGFAGDECNYDLTLTNVSCPCLVLPVSLYYYAGMDYFNHITLNWAVNSEIDLAFFNIEKSTDGLHFLPPQRVNFDPLEGSLFRYSMEDSEPIDGWNYYRLSAVDIQGTSHVLNMISVLHAGKETVEMILLKDEIKARFYVPEAGKISYSVLDVNGREVLKSGMDCTEGKNELNLELGKFAAGVYVLKLSGNNFYAVKKFLKF